MSPDKQISKMPVRNVCLKDAVGGKIGIKKRQNEKTRIYLACSIFFASSKQYSKHTLEVNHF